MILDGVLTAFSGVEQFIRKNDRVHKIIIEKQKDSYDVTTRVSEVLKNENY